MDCEVEVLGEAVEVFVSIQGEGIFVGVPTAFIRLSGCNRRCAYCDTKYAWETPSEVLIRKPFSSEVIERLKNPVYANELVEALMNSFEHANFIRHACITGGEPLLQPDFCKALFRSLKGKGMFTILETQGDLFEPLPSLLQHIDAVSADVKLPSTTNEPLNWDGLERTLKLCAGEGKLVYTKLVVTHDIDIGEIKKAVKLIASVDAHIPFVIQPVTSTGVKRPPSMDLVWRVVCVAGELLKDVRVIPQVHRMLKLP
jgi:organic radical activating enzyme